MYKKIIINSLIIFFISALIHSLYEYLPTFVTSIFVPVNESIWEHMKMIFSSYMLLLLIEWLFYKNKSNNMISGYVLSSVFNIIIFLILFLSINTLLKEHNIVVTLVVYFITILISNFIKYKINKRQNNKLLNKILGFSIILIYGIFTILTYFPLKINLFKDMTTNMYGIYKMYY